MSATATVPWTHFYDMHSGGGQKLQWGHVFIEAPRDEACKLFAEAFGRDPNNVTCDCCGEDYSIMEDATLAEATGHHRGCRYASPLGDDGWRAATTEERQEANRVGRYFEPDEPLPAGWSYHASFHRGPTLTFAEFLADPHFDDFGQRVEVKILARPRSTQEPAEDQKP